MDCAAVRPDWDYVGKLALRRKVAGDVFVVGGYGAELFAGAFMRIEHDDGLPRSLLEVQVESVYVYNGLFHSCHSKRQEPDFCPALHRIAEAQRSVSTHQRVQRVLYQIPPHGASGRA